MTSADHPARGPDDIDLDDRRGLTAAQVAERVERGAVNAVADPTSRPVRAILRANVLTRFNAILGVLLVVVLAVGSPRDALFGIVLVANAAIGITQELRAKRTLDRLAVLHAPHARVRRDGTSREVPVADVVLDDLVELTRGDQVPADGVTLRSEGLEIDEALVTGESEPVDKAPGDRVLSGSVVVAGSGTIRATAVGADAFAHRLAAEARHFTTTRSELVEGTDRILRWITWVLAVVGPILLVSQLALDDATTDEALVGTVAALVGMVPEGLVLLTSLAFVVAALRLTRNQVLVRELPAVEGLARVDVVCFDKTGTLTAGDVVVDRDVGLGASADDEESTALAVLAATGEANPTQRAIAAAFPARGDAEPVAQVPFSSARRWSGVTLPGTGTWVLGGADVVLGDLDAAASTSGGAGDLASRAAAAAATGRRVLALARSPETLRGDDWPDSTTPVGIITCSERVRDDARPTLEYLDSQGVDLKVVSGDHATTVASIASTVGVPHVGRPVDARELPAADDELADLVEATTVFGRVAPDRKRDLVAALQGRGHVVAMTGDGVNDVLALKRADVGMAMGTGAPATRAVAQLVLLDDRFARVPELVAEGRRVIANIERVAQLFLVKNVYSAILALAVAIARSPYPFLPRHLTLVSTLTIGIPAFVLSLAPNHDRYTPGYVSRVVRTSVPVGATIAAAVFVGFALAELAGATSEEASVVATLVAGASGLAVVAGLARPLTSWRLALLVSLAASFAVVLAAGPTRDFFQLEARWGAITFGVGLGLVAAVVVTRVSVAARRRWGVPVPGAPTPNVSAEG